MHVFRPSNPQFANDLQELRRSYLPVLIAAAIAVWWLCTLIWLLPYTSWVGRLWLPLAVSLGACLLALLLYQRGSRSAAHVLVLGLTVSVALAAALLDLSVIPYAFIPIVAAAAFAAGPRFMFICAGLASAALLAIGRAGGLSVFASPLAPELLVLWSVAMTGWLSSRYLYTALEWAMTSQKHAEMAKEQAQADRAELARLLQTQDILSHQLEKANSKLAWALQVADEARQLKFEFATNLSHELRTPLNLVVGFSDMMYKSPEVYGDFAWPPLLRGDIYEINRNAQHLLNLINDVLDLSHVEAGYVALRREPTELAPLITETAAIAGGLLRGRPVQLKLELAEGLPRLSLDRTRIQQVLLNLISNAARFTPQGTITVRACTGDAEVVVSVIDTGIGIPPEDRERVFQEFYTTDGNDLTGGRGTGLGLAISQAFVRLHGGRIWVESEPGQGSAFSFTLPLPEAGIGPVSELPTGRAGTQDRGELERRMAVVDVDGSLNPLLARYIAAWNPLPVADLDAGLAMAAANQVEAIVMQVDTQKFPQALSTLSERATGSREDKRRSVPLLLCAMPTRRERAAELHILDYLNKPIARQDLLAAVEKVKSPVKHVLLVDDDPGFLRLVTRILRSTRARLQTRAGVTAAPRRWPTCAVIGRTW